jgi:hypothetical protein
MKWQKILLAWAMEMIFARAAAETEVGGDGC